MTQPQNRFRGALAALTLLLAGAAAGDSVTASDGRLIPSTLIDVPAELGNVLIADAGAAELVRFARVDGVLAETDRRYMSVGRNGVGKQRAWDRKTPLGVYFLTEELDTTRLADKYGKAAFVMDYPNAWDRYNERTGDGIWLHGVDPRSPDRPRRDTDGCLALPNEDLLSLKKRLDLHDTPIIVTREIEWVPATQVAVTRESLRGALERWRESVEFGDLHAYLSLYADEFSARGMNKEEWAAFKLDAFAARRLDAVRLERILLLRDPEESDLYLSRFVLAAAGDERTLTIRKRLYWRKSGSEWQIVAEDAG